MISSLELIEGTPQFDNSNHMNLKELYRQNIEVMNMIGVKWWSKPRINWLQKGDTNSRFFHLTTNIHRRKNYIHYVLNVFDNEVFYIKEILNVFKGFYEDLWRL